MKKVLRTFVNRAKELMHVCFGGGTVSCMPGHPFYAVGRGWVEAKSLAAGDGLVTQSGEVALVESVRQEVLDEPAAVYNFEVEGWHTYYVGDSAVLAYNDCGDVDDLLKSSADEVVDGAGKITTRDHLLDTVQNDKLKNTINEIYQPGATVGDGGLADVVRHELLTGQLLGGKTHIQKATERVTNLENIVNKQNLNQSDLSIAKSLLDDLKNALGVK